MSKFEVTAGAIMALAVDKNLAIPSNIHITNDLITMEYMGDHTDESQALFMYGLNIYWAFDNNPKTQEWGGSFDSDSGMTTSIVYRRV